MKRRFLVMLVLGLALCLAGAPAWGDDFYVIAGGGPSGKVLKTQVFTSNTTNNTLGTEHLGQAGQSPMDLHQAECHFLSGHHLPGQPLLHRRL